MMNVGWNLLVLSFAFVASAQVPNGCSAPPEYPNSRLLSKYTRLQKFSSGQKVYHDCAEGFTPARGSRVAQCVGGKWTHLTLKCEKRSCGYVGDLPNGAFQYKENTFLGEKVYATCNEGYTLKGLNYMICKKSGWVGELPSCVEEKATCSSPAVANSVNSTGNVSVHRVDDRVTFTCSRGFQLAGAQHIVCGAGGLWQPRPPRCHPSPEKESELAGRVILASRCGVPVTARDSIANLMNKYAAMTSFTSGVKVYYACAVGYVPSGGSRYRRCVEGKWTPLLLKCERKLCGSAGEIINGLFTYTGVEFGDTATAVCDEGHRLVGRATRNCLNKGWDSRVPACEAVVCAAPSAATNAEMAELQEAPFTYRTVIRYRCPAGTLIGQRNIWCTESGTWSDPAPKCKEITCPAPKVANAYWTGGQAMYKDRDTISIECYPGFTKTGPSTVSCGGDGQWSPGLPKCTPRRTYWRS